MVGYGFPSEVLISPRKSDSFPPAGGTPSGRDIRLHEAFLGSSRMRQLLSELLLALVLDRVPQNSAEAYSSGKPSDGIPCPLLTTSAARREFAEMDSILWENTERRNKP